MNCSFPKNLHKNPNLHASLVDLIGRFGLRVGTIPELAMFDDPAHHKIMENAKTLVDNYIEVVQVLKKAKLARWVDQLRYCLVPVWSDDKPELEDQKVGGMPYLDCCLYTKFNGETKTYNLDKVWPKCGCCHQKMMFIGQFDLFPWMLPIHAFTGINNPDWYGGGHNALESDIGNRRAVEHASIFSAHTLHTFMCPIGGQHFDNPGMNVEILLSTTSCSRLSQIRRDENPEKFAQQDAIAATMRECYVRDCTEQLKNIEKETINNNFNEDEARYHQECLKITEKKIDRWELRFEVDIENLSGSNWGDTYKVRNKIEKLAEKHPHLFERYGTAFRLFGTPASQQTPRRFFSVYGRNDGPVRMTPFLNFNDESADFTYQLYTDPKNSDGYTIYGKTDGSCT